jgi:hypothetical protein
MGRAPQVQGSPKTTTLSGAPATKDAVARTAPRRYSAARRKLLDAIGTSGVIAYMTNLQISSDKKGLLLLTAPWIALILNTIVVILSTFAKGYSEIYLQRMISLRLRQICKTIIDNPDTSPGDRASAKADIDDIHNNELRVWRRMKIEIDAMFNYDRQP